MSSQRIRYLPAPAHRAQGRPGEFSWDDKTAGAQLLLWQLTGRESYRGNVQVGGLSFTNILCIISIMQPSPQSPRSSSTTSGAAAPHPRASSGSRGFCWLKPKHLFPQLPVGEPEVRRGPRPLHPPGGRDRLTLPQAALAGIDVDNSIGFGENSSNSNTSSYIDHHPNCPLTS